MYGQLAKVTMPVCIAGMVLGVLPFTWTKVVGTLLISLVFALDMFLFFGMLYPGKKKTDGKGNEYRERIVWTFDPGTKEKFLIVFNAIVDAVVFFGILLFSIFKVFGDIDNVVYWIVTVVICLFFLFRMACTYFDASWED